LVIDAGFLQKIIGNAIYCDHNNYTHYVNYCLSTATKVSGEEKTTVTTARLSLDVEKAGDMLSSKQTLLTI